MVAADGEAVAVARHLPYGQFGVCGLHAGGYGASAPVYGVEAVGVQVVRHAARAAYARYDYRVVGLNSYFRHCFLQGGADGMVAAAGAETYVLV